MAAIKKVLSIDGGGIRGVIPATILAEIESRTKRQISDLFDLVAGTSTGGILALALTRPGSDRKPKYSASDLLDLYKKEGQRIFQASPWHSITALGNVLEEKYPARGIEEVLNEYFGETKLADATTNVLVTAYDIEHRKPFFFKSHRTSAEPERNFPMKAVARATSAAPTYFEPAKVARLDGSDYYAMIDGGVFANNPAMCAYVEARTLFPEATEFLLVSLGTGELTRKIAYDDAKSWGLALWAQPLLGVVFDGVSDTINYQLKKLLLADNRYVRFQVTLTKGSDDLDDARPANVRDLIQLAENEIEEKDAELERLCAELTEIVDLTAAVETPTG